MQINRKYIINISDVEIIKVDKISLTEEVYTARAIITTTTGEQIIQNDYVLSISPFEKYRGNKAVELHNEYIESLLVGEY